MSAGPEYTKVEKPLLAQLEGMGWNTVTGSLDFPSATGRGARRQWLDENGHTLVAV